MSSKIVVFLVGIAIGAGVCAALLSKQGRTLATSATQNASTDFSNQISELKSSLATTQERFRQSQQENEALSARVQEMLKAATAQSALPAETSKPKPKGLEALFGDGTNGMSQAMTDMMKSAAEQQMEATVTGLKSRLNLSADQEKAIRDIMAKQMKSGTEIAQKMFKGELSEEELKELGKDQPNQKEQIKALLTPEQAMAYDEYQKEEQSRMARLVANSELMQMQTQLQLDEAQQDRVFAVLADQALNQFDGRENNAAAAMDFRGQFDRKAAALKDVLTSEQFERYEKFQAQQLKLIESFMPKKTSDGNATP